MCWYTTKVYQLLNLWCGCVCLHVFPDVLTKLRNYQEDGVTVNSIFSKSDETVNFNCRMCLWLSEVMQLQLL